MIHIKKFIDRVSLAESKRSNDIVLPMADARILRDEISKLLADLYSSKEDSTKKTEVIEIELKGGTFK